MINNDPNFFWAYIIIIGEGVKDYKYSFFLQAPI